MPSFAKGSRLWCPQHKGHKTPFYFKNPPRSLFLKELVSGYPFCFPTGAMVKNLPAKAADPSSIPGSERSLGGGKSNPLGNPMDRGAWQAIQRI